MEIAIIVCGIIFHKWLFRLVCNTWLLLVSVMKVFFLFIAVCLTVQLFSAVAFLAFGLLIMAATNYPVTTGATCAALAAGLLLINRAGHKNKYKLLGCDG